MDNEAREKLIGKIRKLLALSTSPNEGEAAAAAEKAHALLVEANLTMADIEGTSEQGMVLDNEVRTDSKPWRRPLASAVARLYFCSHMYHFEYCERKAGVSGLARFDRHCFVGEPHNVAVAKLMFVYLCKTVERLARAGSKDLLSGRGQYEQSFKVGCVGRLCKRIAERIRESRVAGVKTEAGTTLPALASTYDLAFQATQEAMRKLAGDGLEEQTSKRTMNDLRGARDGAAAADQIGLDAQVGGTLHEVLPKH